VGYPRRARVKDGRPRLDRFGTLRAFIENVLAGLTEDGASTPLVWFVLFGWADGRDGTIRGASIMRLARVTGLAENTVRAAMRKLLAEEMIVVEKPGRVPVYRMPHMRAADPSMVEG